MSYSLRSTYTTLPRTTRGQPIVLGGDPKGKNFLYTNGNSVIIRDIANPSLCDVYTEHSTAAIVAKYSPSGYYIASGDASGKVRIWDTTQKEHILKNEFQPLGGAIKDIAWSGDSQRIAVAGDGREKFGHVFNSETGTSVGEIMGHSKTINSVDFRSDRPFRIVTASEDSTLAFFHGPPFKFNMTLSDHTRFVNVVRYAPNNEVFISGGADGRAFIYDGKTAENVGQLGNPAHSGGIYGLGFSGDSRQCLTVSGDKTARLWDVATGDLVTEFKMGTDTTDMQVGCLWQGPFLLTVSLSGNINYLDLNNPERPVRIVKGHNKPITAMTLSSDKDMIYTASSDGHICEWNVETGENDMLPGKGHSNQVQDMVMSDRTLISCGIDDTVIFTSTDSKEYGVPVKMPSQPRSIAASTDGLTVVACINEVVVMRDQRIVFSQKVTFEPLSVAIHPGQTEVAVGGEADHKVHIFTLDGDTLKETQTIENHKGALTDIKYNPEGSIMAAADANRRILLYTVPGYKRANNADWCMHTARVNSLSWTPDSQHLGSGSLDCGVIGWTPAKTLHQVQIKGAHPMNQVKRVQWLDNNTLVSVGQDSCVRIWNFKFD